MDINRAEFRELRAGQIILGKDSGAKYCMQNLAKHLPREHNNLQSTREIFTEEIRGLAHADRYT